MSTFWSIWVIVLVVINIGGALWLLFATRKVEVRKDQPEGQPPTTGHIYDGIEEYDNPLPAWWFKMFVLTVVFAVIYLILYPGLGNFPGLLNWSSAQEWEEDVEAARERYAPLFARYNDTPVEELAFHPEAMKMGGRLFANNCAQCHGSDGRGSYGFPNLADDDWLWGGDPDAIKTSIAQGRTAAMPGWSGSIGEEGIQNVTQYVLELAGREHDEARAEQGAETYATYCAACHGSQGKGNTAMGAPDLTNNVWLYGGSPESIRHTLRNGRSGEMPAQKELLSEDKIHILTAYVYGLSERHQQ